MIRNYLYVYASLYPIIITTDDIKARSIDIIIPARRRVNFGPRIDIGINCSPRVADHYTPSDRHDTVPRFALLRAFKRGPIAICRRSILVARTRFPLPRDIRVGAGVKRDGLIQ